MITQTVESIVKGKAIQELVRVPASATVADAVAAMAKREMGSVLVGSPGGAIEGIFTERDVMRRVVGEGPQLGSDGLELAHGQGFVEHPFRGGLELG